MRRLTRPGVLRRGGECLVIESSQICAELGRKERCTSRCALLLLLLTHTHTVSLYFFTLTFLEKRMNFQPRSRFSIKLPANPSLFESSATTAGSFGVVAGVFALFFFSEVPKVRKDIMQVRFPPGPRGPSPTYIPQLRRPALIAYLPPNPVANCIFLFAVITETPSHRRLFPERHSTGGQREFFPHTFLVLCAISNGVV